MQMNKVEARYEDGRDGHERFIRPDDKIGAIMDWTTVVRHTEMIARNEFRFIGVSMVGEGTAKITLTIWGYNKKHGEDGVKFATVTLTFADAVA